MNITKYEHLDKVWMLTDISPDISEVDFNVVNTMIDKEGFSKKDIRLFIQFKKIKIDRLEVLLSSVYKILQPSENFFKTAFMISMNAIQRSSIFTLTNESSNVRVFYYKNTDTALKWLSL